MLVQALVNQIRLATLVANNDPIAWLNYTDNQILDLININAPLFSRKIGALTLANDIDEALASLILTKCHIDICYRMSMGEARNYPLMAEGASLRKDYIFEHYMSIIRSLKDDLRVYHEEYKRGTPINISKVLLNRDVDHRLTTEYPNASLTATAITSGVELAWNKFEYLRGGYFKKYSIIIINEADKGYDPVTNELPDVNVQKFTVDYYNPLQVSTRVEGLQPATDYKALLVVYNALDMFSVDTKAFTTL